MKSPSTNMKKIELLQKNFHNILIKDVWSDAKKEEISNKLKPSTHVDKTSPVMVPSEDEPNQKRPIIIKAQGGVPIPKIPDLEHKLTNINRPRVKGYCVECLKGKSKEKYKETMVKIRTYCPACPGGNWICDLCFKKTHV